MNFYPTHATLPPREEENLPLIYAWTKTLELRAAFYTSVARELVIKSNVSLFLERLHQVGVRGLLIKGTALAYSYYEYPCLRSRVDTDLFISKDDLPALTQVMRSLGYQTENKSNIFSAIVFFKNNGFADEIIFDVHWKISNRKLFEDLVDFKQALSTAVSVPKLGPHAYCLSLENTLLLACVHPHMHHSKTQRYLWHYDIYLIVSKMTSNEIVSFCHLAIQKRVAALCSESLRQATSLIQFPFPFQKLETKEEEKSEVFLNRRIEIRDEVFSDLLHAKGWTGRFLYLKRLLFPQSTYVLKHKKYRLLLPYYYLERIVRGILKHAKG